MAGSGRRFGINHDPASYAWWPRSREISVIYRESAITGFSEIGQASEECNV